MFEGIGLDALKALIDERIQQQGGVLDKVYPVGSIYMSVQNVSPADFIGGTWTPLDQGRVLIGAGTAHPAGEEGGAETVTLTAEEIPAHAHSLNKSASFSGSTSSSGTSHTHGIGTGDWSGKGRILEGSAVYTTRSTDSAGSHSHSFSGTVTLSGDTGSAGSGNAHDNMQPYLSVYMWKRTA